VVAPVAVPSQRPSSQSQRRHESDIGRRMTNTLEPGSPFVIIKLYSTSKEDEGKRRKTHQKF